MKKVIFNSLIETFKSVDFSKDISEAQKAFKEIFDIIQQVPCSIKTENTSTTEDDKNPVLAESTREYYTSEMGGDRYDIFVDTFGFSKYELNVRIENDTLIVSGKKKQKIATVVESFTVKIPFTNSEVTGEIKFFVSVLTIPCKRKNKSSTQEFTIG